MSVDSPADEIGNIGLGQRVQILRNQSTVLSVTQSENIEALVRAYQPTSDERSHSAATALLRQDRVMWRRTDFDPGHFTASGFVVSSDGGSLLLILHGKLGRWLQPGGHIDSDDPSAEAAARREVFEETGVANLRALADDPVRMDVHKIPAREPEPKHLHFDLGFGFQAAGEDIGPLDEVSDAKWVRFEHLDQYHVDEAVVHGALAARRLL